MDTQETDTGGESGKSGIKLHVDSRLYMPEWYMDGRIASTIYTLEFELLGAEAEGPVIASESFLPTSICQSAKIALDFRLAGLFASKRCHRRRWLEHLTAHQRNGRSTDSLLVRAECGVKGLTAVPSPPCR